MKTHIEKPNINAVYCRGVPYDRGYPQVTLEQYKTDRQLSVASAALGILESVYCKNCTKVADLEES